MSEDSKEEQVYDLIDFIRAVFASHDVDPAIGARVFVELEFVFTEFGMDEEKLRKIAKERTKK